jgi:hypothetical protein
MVPLFPTDWFWIVDGDESRAWSSAAAAYLDADDPAYLAWRDAGGAPSRIVSEAELGDVLASHGLTTGALPAPRRELPKSTVQARLDAVGKLAACFAILQSDAALFGRWFAPDWPNVYVDDEGLLQVLEAAGCTPAEIAAITA